MKQSTWYQKQLLASIQTSLLLMLPRVPEMHSTKTFIGEPYPDIGDFYSSPINVFVLSISGYEYKILQRTPIFKTNDCLKIRMHP